MKIACLGVRLSPLALLLSLLLQGCSDSSSPGYPGVATFSDANGGNSGRLYISAKGQYFDLNNGLLVDVGGSFLSPSKDGLEYISVHEDFDYLDVPDCFYGQDFDRVSIYDAASGEVRDSFTLPADIFAVRLSPDKQKIGAFYEDGSVCFESETAFTVFSRDGEVLRSARPDGIKSFDWLPDNRLVVALNGGIYVEETPDTLMFNRIADLTNVSGNPTRITANTSGTQVLFEMTTEVPGFLVTVRYRDATVWSVDIDGSNLRQRVTSTDSLTSGSSEDPSVNAPTWSPDGNQFIVTEGYLSGGVIDGSTVSPGVIAVNNNGITYIVDSTADPMDLPDAANTTDSARPLMGIRRDGSIGAIRLDPFSRQFWAPSPN